MTNEVDVLQVMTRGHAKHGCQVVGIFLELRKVDDNAYSKRYSNLSSKTDKFLRSRSTSENQTNFHPNPSLVLEAPHSKYKWCAEQDIPQIRCHADTIHLSFPRLPTLSRALQSLSIISRNYLSLKPMIQEQGHHPYQAMPISEDSPADRKPSKMSIKVVLSYILDWVVLIAVGVVSYIIGDLQPNKRPISLTDPSIS
jgi:hypothetical protein